MISTQRAQPYLWVCTCCISISTVYSGAKTLSWVGMQIPVARVNMCCSWPRPWGSAQNLIGLN